MLWWDTADHDDLVIGQQVETLAAIVDDVMARGSGLQAFIARWNWSTLYQGGAQSTPYEYTCGVHGQCTTGRAWCSRWLRAATERIWLGPELLARLPERDVLQSICELTSIRDGMRAVLRPTATLDDLELSLAAILPGLSDWEHGVNLLYGHCHASDVGDADMR